MTRTRGVVLDPVSLELDVEELELAEPRADQVRVRIMATGVCHSDLHMLDGDWPAATQLVLGHEGAGVVDAVGPDVRDVAVGDHVVLSWFAPCRRCESCAAGRGWLCSNSTATANTLPDGTTPLRTDAGEPVFPFLGLGTFADYTVVPEAAAIVVPTDLPFDVASLIGCAVTTGVGAVTNTARVRAGESAVVIGCGGVGQAALLGLGLVGADPIVAVDLSDERLALAVELGATHGLRGDDPALRKRVLEITGGAHHVFEAIGRPETIQAMPAMLRPGGQAVVVGMTRFDAEVTVRPFHLADRGLSILGCNYGSSVAAVDFPRLARLHLAGRLPLGRLVGDRKPLDGVHEAFADLRAARGLRTVLQP